MTPVRSAMTLGARAQDVPRNIQTVTRAYLGAGRGRLTTFCRRIT
jgi:hypothetical protein